MILLVCCENRGGMMFFGKRLSRDRVLTERILALTGAAPLHVTAYSAAMLEGAENLNVSDDPASHAGAGEFYFAENAPLPTEGVEEIHRFLWNRDYPADRFFDPKDYGAALVSATEFAGYSHYVITHEICKVVK